MASKRGRDERQTESYEDTQFCKSIELTLGATVVTTVTLPDNVKGFRLFPASNNIRFSINNVVVAKATSAATTIPETAFVLGNVAKADRFETRLLPARVTSGPIRTLTLLALSGTTVELDLF